MYATVTNNLSVGLEYPIRLALTNLGPSGTTVQNAHGNLNDGTPYFEFTGTGVLAPGQTTTNLVIAIKAPRGTRYSFAPQVIAVVVDNPGDSLTVIQERVAVSPRFQNADDRFDVNADGSVTGRDALNVVNQLGRGADLVAADLAAVIGARASMLVDVNGDGIASSLDALHVINELSRRGSAEPNYAAMAETDGKKSEEDKIVDEIYSDLSEEDSSWVDIDDESVRLITAHSRIDQQRDLAESDASEHDQREPLWELDLNWLG